MEVLHRNQQKAKARRSRSRAYDGTPGLHAYSRKGREKPGETVNGEGRTKSAGRSNTGNGFLAVRYLRPRPMNRLLQSCPFAHAQDASVSRLEAASFPPTPKI